VLQESVESHVLNVNCSVVLLSLYSYMASFVASNQDGVLLCNQLCLLPVNHQHKSSLVGDYILHYHLRGPDQELLAPIELHWLLSLHPYKSTLRASQVHQLLVLINGEVSRANGGCFEEM